jgi:hypothetical protein
MYYKLIRNMAEGKAVPGKLYRVSHYFNKRTGVYVEHLTPICPTLENADYLIPALIYRITITQSPKFKRLLPFINQVPGRTGIRVHRGTKPEHSRGCILVSAEHEKHLTELWLTEQHEKEETRLEICAQ